MNVKKTKKLLMIGKKQIRALVKENKHKQKEIILQVIKFNRELYKVPEMIGQEALNNG